MAKRQGYIESEESKNWNVAQGYSLNIILRELILIKEYEDIAFFGTSELIQEFQMDERLIDLTRVRAIRRLTRSLKNLIINTTFALKSKDRDKFKEFKIQLDSIQKILPALSYKVSNQRDKTIVVKIQEEKFFNVLDILLELKGEMLFPLNRADLIFSSSDEIDPTQLKKDIMDNIINNG